MPNRILRDGILASEKVAGLGWAAEVFYRRLMSIADDYGRYEAGHQLLRARCYPLQTDDVKPVDIARWLVACQSAGLLVMYVVDGKRYLEIVRFQQQQRSASKCPAPPAVDSKCSQPIANEHLDVVVVGGVVEGGDGDGTPKAHASVPSWIPPEAWERWRKHRGRKLTPEAVKLQIKKLAGLLAQGHQPADVIALAIESGWATFYEPRKGFPGGDSKAAGRGAVMKEIFKEQDNERTHERIIDGEAERVA